MATSPKKASSSNTTTTTTTTTTVTKGKKVTTVKKVTAPAKSTSASASKSTTTAAKLARVSAGEWVCGPNERWPLCAPVAIANSLLACTGIRASHGALERLCTAAGGHRGTGVPLAAALASAAAGGLAGCGLEWEPLWGDYTAVPGAVVLLDLDAGLHAAAITSDGLAVLWGEPSDVTTLAGSAGEAFRLTWR
jgi:hypothetical protein